MGGIKVRAADLQNGRSEGYTSSQNVQRADVSHSPALHICCSAALLRLRTFVQFSRSQFAPGAVEQFRFRTRWRGLRRRSGFARLLALIAAPAVATRCIAGVIAVTSDGLLAPTTIRGGSRVGGIAALPGILTTTLPATLTPTLATSTAPAPTASATASAASLFALGAGLAVAFGLV